MATIERAGVAAPSAGRSDRMSPWFIGTLAVFLIIAAAFGMLWASEASSVADLETSLATVEAQLADAQGALVAVEAQLADGRAALATAEADLAALQAEAEAATTAVDPHQEGVEAMFTGLAEALAGRDANAIAAHFADRASSTNYGGVTETGTAEEIGKGYVDYGAIVVTMTGSPVISGDGDRFAAVQPASAFGHTGFLATKIRVVDGEYLIEDINWYAP